MSSLAHIVAIAEHMLDHFGDAAASVAGERARNNLGPSDEEAFVLWHRVGTAVRELQRLRNSP